MPWDNPRHRYLEQLEIKYAMKIGESKELKMQRYVGTVQSAIIEDYDADEEVFRGRVWWQAPEIDGMITFENTPKGDSPFVNVEITDALPDYLYGSIQE